MIKNERGELGLAAFLALLFGSALIVGAVALNESSNISEVILDSVELAELPIAEINLTNESLELDSSIKTDEPIAESLVEIHKEKLNQKTKDLLKDTSNKKQEKEFIVKFKNFIDEDMLEKVKIRKKYEDFDSVKVKGKIEDIETLLDSSDVEYLELDQKTEVLSDSIQYNIEKTNAPSVWNITTGNGVKIAVLDTGISPHLDLIISGGVSVIGGNYSDSNGHGTAVASVISAVLNNQGIIGVAPDASIYAVKIMSGSSGSLSDAISGIEWAIDNNISIVTMSFGMEDYSQIFKEVLDEAYDSGILLISASGNEGADEILYPAAYDSVIAVGAVDSNDDLASFSSYGPDQELVAPGVSINSTYLSNGYSVLSGTSMAAPHVAGVAALIKSYNQSLTNSQIRAKLRNDALDLGSLGKDNYFGYGLVQVKLDTSDYTLVNNSYFYEIFNISDYGLDNISFSYWLSGNGSIDDVDFMPGYYLANITYQNGDKREFYYNVSENGTLFLLTLSLSFLDNFTQEGSTTTDKIVWVGSNFSTKVTGSSPSTIFGMCYENASSLSFQWDYCFFNSTSSRNSCEDAVDTIDCDETDCYISAYTKLVGSDWHSWLETLKAGRNTPSGRYFTSCSPDNTEIPSGFPFDYYILDKKRINCINSSYFWSEGHYGNNNWLQLQLYDCGTGNTCTNNNTNYTNPNAVLDSIACLPDTLCSGTVQIITEDANGNPINGTNVFRDGDYKGRTNEFGFFNNNLTRTCGTTLNYNVSCSNNQTVCGQQSTSLSVYDDFKSLIFDCSACVGTPDLQVSIDDVRTSKTDGTVTVNISLAGSFTSTNVNVTFKVQDKDGLIAREKSQLFNIATGDNFKVINQSIQLDSTDEFLHVYADSKNLVSESNEKNNYALVPLFKPTILAYINVSTGYPLIDQEIKDYLKLYVEEKPQGQANVTIAIGLPKKNAIIESENWYTQKNYNWWFTYSVNYNGFKYGSKPYNAIVGGFKDGDRYIFVGGNDIDGVLAGVKRLISARTLFFNNLDKQKISVIGDLDTAGIAVADLLRNPTNYQYYNQRSSSAFAQVVGRILNNNNYQIAIKTVQTLNTTSYNQSTILRLKNVNSDFSTNYKNVLVNGSTPLVMSGGIFSTLTTWENDGKGLAWDLVNDGHDVWEIELNGGENTECDNCPDYTYQDQADYFWPALVAGVMNYSGKNKVHYIGHSNGCRVALSSLNSYSIGKNSAGLALSSVTGLYDVNVSLPNLPVDKFFGVACPGTLDDDTTLLDLTDQVIDSPFGFVGYNGDYAMKKVNQSNKNHIKNIDYLSKLLTWSSRSIIVDLYAGESFLFEDEKISRNLMQFYNDLSIYNNTLDLSNISVNKFYLFNAKPSDFLVEFDDQVRILATVQTQKKGFNYTGPKPGSTDHGSIKDNNNIKKGIVGGLNE